MRFFFRGSITKGRQKKVFYFYNLSVSVWHFTSFFIATWVTTLNQQFISNPMDLLIKIYGLFFAKEFAEFCELSWCLNQFVFEFIYVRIYRCLIDSSICVWSRIVVWIGVWSRINVWIGVWSQIVCSATILTEKNVNSPKIKHFQSKTWSFKTF